MIQRVRGLGKGCPACIPLYRFVVQLTQKQSNDQENICDKLPRNEAIGRMSGKNVEGFEAATSTRERASGLNLRLRAGRER